MGQDNISSSIAVEFCLSVNYCFCSKTWSHTFGLMVSSPSFVSHLHFLWIFSFFSPLFVNLDSFPSSFFLCGALSWKSTLANSFPQFVGPRFIQCLKILLPSHYTHLQITLPVQLQSSNWLPILPSQHILAVLELFCSQIC